MVNTKLNITIDETNWLEATWSSDKTVLHCESFSGHPEHIAMLEAKAIEFCTDLKEFVDVIKQTKDKFVMPTEEELVKEELKNKIAEYKYLLDSTQFKFGEDYDKKNTPEWEDLKLKRAEAREFIRSNS